MEVDTNDQDFILLDKNVLNNIGFKEHEGILLVIILDQMIFKTD